MANNIDKHNTNITEKSKKIKKIRGGAAHPGAYPWKGGPLPLPVCVCNGHYAHKYTHFRALFLC